MENNKNQAEIYRQERKERLAKAAAKNAKKSPKSIKAKKIAKKVIAIVLAVVVALGAVGGILSFFDVAEKTVKVSVDGIEAKVSLAEFNYYYYMSWYQFFSYAQQYDAYGEGMGLAMTGFDYSKTPDQQEYTDDSSNFTGVTLEDMGNPENPTWEDAFTYSAVSQIVYAKYGAAKAEEAKIELTDEEIEDITSQLDSVRDTAKEKDYSLNRWLRMNYGAGVTEKLIYNATVESTLAAKYFEKYTDDTTASITNEMIDERYEANKDAYDIADIRIYEFVETADEADHADMSEEEHEAAHAEADAASKAKAEEFIAEATDEKSFIRLAQSAILTKDNDSEDKAEEVTLVEKASYSSLSSYCDEVAEWVFDDARTVGEIGYVTDGEGSYFVMMIKALPYKNTNASSSDVRHILVQFPDKNTDGSATSKTDDSGNNVSSITDETKNATKEKAQVILDEYLKNPTEDNFITLAKEKSNDTGSATNGGLIEGISDNGQYVATFTEWAVNPERRPGDVEIVESEYGYHIMYYVKANEETWYLTVQNEIVSETLEKTLVSEIDSLVDAFDYNTLFVNWTINKQNDHIADIILNNVK